MKLYCGHDNGGDFWIYPLMKVGNFTYLCLYMDATMSKQVSFTSFDESQLQISSLKEKKLTKERQRRIIEKIMNGELIHEMSLYHK